MATITGRITRDNGVLNVNHDDVLPGTASDDTIDGIGGNDTIYAGFGNDTVRGGYGNDYLYASSQGNTSVTAAWGNDTVYGGAGNDTLWYYNTTSNVTLYGDYDAYSTDDGNDTIYAGSGSDRLYGGNGNDWLFGGAGHDVIYGDFQSGNIPGTGGSDVLIGGAGYDDLYGGIGDDKFVFYSGDSIATYSGADVIWDFNSIHDKIQIVGGPSVNSGNYFEGNVASSGNAVTDFNTAANVADAYLNAFDYVFLTNGKQGYLFADVNYDGNADYGIELKGLTSVSDFSQYSLLT